MVHTARWPKDYQKEEWKNDRVAVIGSGASSIQTVPTMQPYVKHLDIFVRTAVWFVQIANNYGQNKEYDDKEKSDFKKDPKVSANVEFQNSVKMLTSGRRSLLMRRILKVTGPI